MHQLVLPPSLRGLALKGCHDDVGHLGRDRTISLLQERFYWPSMSVTISEYVSKRRKSLQFSELLSLLSRVGMRMELVCVDFLKSEPSKGGIENLLVVTDHFSKYAQAYPCKNQTALTTAHVLYENFFLHYGFPAKLYSDQGRNF